MQLSRPRGDWRLFSKSSWKHSAAWCLALPQYNIAIHHATFAVCGKTRNFSRLASFARGGNERINFAFFEAMAITPQPRLALPPKEIIARLKLRSIKASGAEFFHSRCIPRLRLFSKLLVAHKLPKRQAHHAARHHLLQKRIDETCAQLKRWNVVQKAKAAHEIARLARNHVGQVRARLKFTNDVDALEAR